jgi:hypothetical protein
MHAAKQALQQASGNLDEALKVMSPARSAALLTHSPGSFPY